MVAEPGTATGRTGLPTSATMGSSPPRIGSHSTPPSMSKRANLGRDVAGTVVAMSGLTNHPGGDFPHRAGDQGHVSKSPTDRAQDRVRPRKLPPREPERFHTYLVFEKRNFANSFQFDVNSL